MPFIFLFLVVSTFLYSEPHIPMGVTNSNPHKENSSAALRGYGIRFTCSPEQIQKIKSDMVELLKSENLHGKGFITYQQSPDGKVLEYSLDSQEPETSTFSFVNDSKYQVTNESETYMNQRGNSQTIQFASKKEILLSLLQRGRMTEFKDKSCNIGSLKDHIGMRQNISRWGARAWFTFPEDGSIKRNPEYWAQDSWTVKPEKVPSEAIADAFTSKNQYAIACTKAVQFIMAQGILDYQRTIKKNSALIKDLDTKLGDYPLSSELAPHEESKPGDGQHGILLDRQYGVPWNNWVPGEWGWIMNNDVESAKGFGMEGSNIVYIGNGYFGVYYDDAADRTIDEALLRVYHWRDLAKRENIPEQELLNRIRKSPFGEGGMLNNERDVPKRFD